MIITLISALFCVSYLSAQNYYYDVTKTFYENGYTYQCDVQRSKRVLLYNKENELTYTKWVFKDTGKEPPLPYNIDDVKDERYSKQMVNYEVTESAYANVSGKGTNFLIQLHDNGVKLLIDDFGSGMSSFSTLRDYDFDVIKLDMGFVQKLGENKKYNNIHM